MGCQKGTNQIDMEHAFFKSEANTEVDEGSVWLRGAYGLLAAGMVVLGVCAPQMAHWIFTVMTPAVNL